jgi:NADH:ubiquinone oxidoreductase subunit F (NADH-binding)/(2Fe-2S) ferredoxin
MKQILTVDEFKILQSSLISSMDTDKPRLHVCDGTGCRALGSEKVLSRLRDEICKNEIDVDIEVVGTGCPGFCECGPLVTIYPQRISYVKVAPKDVPEIINETLLAGNIIDRLLFTDPITGEHIHKEPDLPFYKTQTRSVLGLNGQIDPQNIEQYIAYGGYSSLAKVLSSMTPEDVIDEVKSSMLRGRGGAGFPTGLKWDLCRKNVLRVGAGYVICNADEGDPGAFMDRSLLEGNPHSVIEGMIIGAYAIGVSEGYFYIRAEYPLAVENITIALQQAQKAGLLGSNILGTDYNCHLDIRLGAGAFVCGEETALMASIEGRVGEPRPRPPYPAQEGLWGRPSNINNVETWSNVPAIIHNGGEVYAQIGTDGSKGTKIFSLVGNINNTGLVEVPMGISLREIVYDIGGGIPGNKVFKAAQLGGPSGGCIPLEHIDVPIDYESLTSLGAIMGSGGMVIADEETCMVDFARYFMKFTQEESCGKCVPCRVGTKAMLETLERICAGDGRHGDVEYLVEIGEAIKNSSLCGLGQSAPNPVLSTIRYFREEYDAHIEAKTCPAKVCKGLITYEIIPEKCPGCMVCLRNCPGGAITGAKKEVHVIDPDLCTRCGVCQSLCQFDAVIVY